MLEPRDIDRLVIEVSAVFVGVLLGLSPIWFQQASRIGTYILGVVTITFGTAFIIAFFGYINSSPSVLRLRIESSLVTSGVTVAMLLVIFLGYEIYPSTIPHAFELTIISSAVVVAGVAFLAFILFKK